MDELIELLKGQEHSSYLIVDNKILQYHNTNRKWIVQSKWQIGILRQESKLFYSGDSFVEAIKTLRGS